MDKHHVKVNLYAKESFHISLKGHFFFGETQRRLSGEWEVIIRDNKIYIENEEQILMVDEEIMFSPLKEQECGFRIIDVKQSVDHSKLCNTYKGKLILSKSADTIIVYNEVEIESFIRNILCHQFPDCKQYEFLKVQALILRSNVLQYSLNGGILSFQSKEDDLDFYEGNLMNLFLDTSHKNLITLYRGFPDRCNEISHRAVDDTKGKVLVYNDEVCFVPQTLCCGGVTNSNGQHIFKNKECKLHSTYDTIQNIDVDLSQTQNLEQWIYNPINFNCSNEDELLIDQLKSKQIKHDSSLFRWNDILKGVTVASVLQNSLNLIVGRVEEIQVVERSTSGLTKCIVVKGNKGEVSLKGHELQKFIRGANLQSGTFLIDTKKEKNNADFSFTINGSGTGSGKGLCQIGAMHLAENGESMEVILQHYFSGIYIEKQY